MVRIVVCLLTLCAATLAKSLTNSELKDNVSAESRLYKNVPVGVYASVAPYAAYSFHVPSIVAPKSLPIKEASVNHQNNNGFLKDSYGNQFAGTPQSMGYKSMFPQQFVQLQNLPVHLSQPLVSSSIQYKHSTPHFFAPGQYGVQNIQLPQTLNRYTIQQPISFTENTRNPSIIYSQFKPQQLPQQQPSNNNNIYANAFTVEQFNNLKNQPKFQRLQTADSQHNDETQQLLNAPKQTTITTISNGKKIAVNLITKPPLPLLDLSLLEPLHFANPLVPQVQHFLPRINSAVYHKLPNVQEVKKHQMEFVVQNTKSYDSTKDNQKKVTPKRKHKKVTQKHMPHEDEPDSPTVTAQQDIPNESPEIVYEINSPNYKETVSEKKISYNKETETAPKTYNYEMNTQSQPVHYSYEKNSQKEPVHISHEHHEEKAPIHHNYEEHTQKEPIRYNYVKIVKEPTHKPGGSVESHEDPNHLIYHIKADEEEGQHNNNKKHNSAENSDESHEEENRREPIDDIPHKNYDEQIHYIEVPEQTQDYNPEHRQVQYYQEKPKELQQHSPQSPGPKNIAHFPKEQEQIILHEHEEEIEIEPQQREHSSIKVDPNQHIQTQEHTPRHPQEESHRYDYPRSFYSSAPIIKGTPKQEVSNDEAKDDVRENNNEKEEDREENEEDFEKSYMDAAYGFAAYHTPRVDVEKEIYNPQTYGSPKYYSEYNIEKTPLQQYQAGGDEFPEFARSNYKEARDKMQEKYYLDYEASRPEGLGERHKNKENYYALYNNQKPETYSNDEKEEKKSEKYTVIPTYHYREPAHKQSKHNKPKPAHYEFRYTNEEPKDASAHASRPHIRYNGRTQFVEPQYQYGFEPISIPQLLDSELAAMASSNNPKSQKGGLRKKTFKENLFIKTTSTKGSKKIS
ncbi:unnamed protein product [Leptidea sinapis]|uniref:Uncharacterized protein n=1 Tax=Leptidea sinapis TaxID=189913 RepID=A0A5E4QW91_9NEOP|nr:unnamed protein product [Leptidea sinapis]